MNNYENIAISNTIDTKILLEESFYQKIVKKYHYEQKQLKDIMQLSFCMKKLIEADMRHKLAGWWSRNEDSMNMCVVLTLGPSVDELEAEFAENGKLLEAYMVENISSEFLMDAYEEINRNILEKQGKSIASFHFFGSDEKYPIEYVSTYLNVMKTSVLFLQEKALSPKKSVIFMAELSDHTNGKCQGICATCTSTKCERRE